MRNALHLRTTGMAIFVFLASAAAAFAGEAEPPTYYPASDEAWERVDPAKAGWDPDKIREALDIAGEAKSSGVVILLGGRILAEKYWEPSKARQSLRYQLMIRGKIKNAGPVEDVASAQKSVVSFLAGVAQSKSLLDFDAPVARYLGKGWSKASKVREAKITVLHLLSMSSGLKDNLEYQAPAGSVWKYNTAAYSRLQDVLEKITGKDLNALTREWLTAPIGMSESRWVKRRPVDRGNPMNANGFATTSRDLARFGLLVLRRARWNDRDLLDNPDYLKTAFSPSQEMNKAYGLLWWLNGQPVQRGNRKLDALIPAAPKDLFAAQGALGRKLYIVPSLDLVVTRLGDNAPADFPNRFWTALAKAAPKTAPKVAFQSEPGKVLISIGGAPFASYVYEDPDIPRPYFAHVKAPNGTQVTRNHPPVEGKDRTDHGTYHPGVWLTFGDVNGNDYWRLKAKTKHERFVGKPKGGPGRGSFAVENRYLSEDGAKTVCVETCRYTVLVREAGYLLIIDSSFTSGEGDFTFGDQEEFGLGIRVATPISVKEGGRITNSDGMVNEKKVWGKQADWCDYGGPVEGEWVGMTVMPAPKNFRRSWYHARDYGFVAANPFGRKAMKAGEESKVVVKKGEIFRLGYGLLVHSSPKDEDVDLDAAYRDYLIVIGGK